MSLDRRPRRTRRRLVGLTAGGLAALATIGAAPALGDALVNGLGPGNPLTLEITPPVGADHAYVVEPFIGEGRNGWRVRQREDGNPPLSAGSNCLGNPFFNDVVCDIARTSVFADFGSGDDALIVRGTQPGGVPGQPSETPFGPTVGPSCSAGNPLVVVTADLGPGDDVLDFEPGELICTNGFVDADGNPIPEFADGEIVARFDVDGGSGEDSLRGGPLGDVLRGGSRNDTIRGEEGADQLFGDADDDVLIGGLGADQLSGGTGFDTASYEERSAPVTIGAGANDGEAGEGDNVFGSVERVIGGSGNDRLVGNGDPNTLEGGPGIDVLEGNGGNDVLIGGPGSDRIFVNREFRLTLPPFIRARGPGAPRAANQVDLTQGVEIRAGTGNEFIDARNGLLDGIDCGSGFDLVHADLVDAIFVGCEQIVRFALDDGPPAGVVGTRVPFARGATTIRLACPRAARVACRGTLTLRAGGARGRILARAAYRVPLGAARTLRPRLLGHAPARGARVTLRSEERGVSRVGPRGVTATLAAGRR